MASEVSICNLALSHLGDVATVSSIEPPEGSAQSEHCAIFYPQARDTLLEMHAWSFATRRVQAAQLVASTWSYRYAYAVPQNCLKVLSVLPFHALAGAESDDFEVESAEDGTRIVLTDLEGATVRFIQRVTDPSKFSPLFVDALAWLLASHLAGPIIKGDTGAAAAMRCFQTFRTQFASAAASDANQRQGDPRRDERATPWIRGRN